MGRQCMEGFGRQHAPATTAGPAQHRQTQPFPNSQSAPHPSQVVVAFELLHALLQLLHCLSGRQRSGCRRRRLPRGSGRRAVGCSRPVAGAGEPPLQHPELVVSGAHLGRERAQPGGGHGRAGGTGGRRWSKAAAAWRTGLGFQSAADAQGSGLQAARAASGLRWKRKESSRAGVRVRGVAARLEVCVVRRDRTLTAPGEASSLMCRVTRQCMKLARQSRIARL